MDLNEIQSRMDRFVTDQGWYQSDSAKPQTAKNLTISLILEAAELLECFQWNDQANQQAVAAELADVILYAAQIANIMNINLEDAVAQKLALNKTRRWTTSRMEG